MLKKIFAVALVALSLPVGLINDEIFFNQREGLIKEENAILESLAEEVEAEIIESSIKLIYHVDKDVKAELLELLAKTEVPAVIETSDDKIFSFNINEDDIYMEFKGVNLSDKGEVTIKVTSLHGEKSLDYLEKYLQYYTENKAEGRIYFKYLKGKLENEETDYYSQRLNKALEDLGASSIHPLQIHNGITCTAFIKSNALNLNYSICKYDTSTYLIIGTPILDEIY